MIDYKYRLDAISDLERRFLEEWAEDQQDGTDFDCYVLDTFNRLREWVMRKSGVPNE